MIYVVPENPVIPVPIYVLKLSQNIAPAGYLDLSQNNSLVIGFGLFHFCTMQNTYEFMNGKNLEAMYCVKNTKFTLHSPA
jgi:hypothetical protein